MNDPERASPSDRRRVRAFEEQLALKVALETPSIDLEPADADHGAVFTRRWVVELILDLAGFTTDRPLDQLVAIEPACGDGAFLVPMVKRLSDACKRRGRSIGEAVGAIRGFDLQAQSVQASRDAVTAALIGEGSSPSDARNFAARTIHRRDFLLEDHVYGEADFVLGNPPYVRLESVPAGRTEAYRRACSTMAGRADIYVGFFEVGLKALKADGALAFICADRWMRNQYGRVLRALVAEHFSFEAAIEMHEVDAFVDEVSAYPSIVVLRRRAQQPTLVAETTAAFGSADAAKLASWAQTAAIGDEAGDTSYRAAMLPGWFPAAGSWPSGSPARLAILRELEDRLPPLEDAATRTRVGIGVATGSDRVFVTKDKGTAEAEQMLPLAMAADTMTGDLLWSGHYLVNPWRNDGEGLVDLDEFPRLASYYKEHRDQLLRRNVAKRRPKTWFRTIDRVDLKLTFEQKLLFPDIKATIHPVLDKGKTYPHHNLYFVASKEWDLEVLGGLLLSRVAQLFIEAYAVRMRGGYLRFQAQYLRRIRVPRLADVSVRDAARLRKAFRARDVEMATSCALKLYGLAEVPD